MSFEEIVRGRIPVLREFADRICALTNEILNEAATNNEDNFGVMGICFLSKQLHHLKAIVHLQNHRDAELIARSMLEGYIQLSWCSIDSDNRARQWREFGRIHNYQILKRNPRLSELLKEEAKVEFRENAENLVHFYRASAKQKISMGKSPPPNLFVNNWFGEKTIWQLFSEVPDGTELYALYSHYSDWHHWSFAGLARALDVSANDVRYKANSPLSAAQGLTTGFQCLLKSCDIVVDHFGLDFEEKLQQIYDGYIQANAEFESR